MSARAAGGAKMAGLMAALAFYNYGRKAFNQRGYVAGRLNVSAPLSGRVFVVTGSNSGYVVWWRVC